MNSCDINPFYYTWTMRFSKISFSLGSAAKGAVLALGATAAMACTDSSGPDGPAAAIRFVNAAPLRAEADLKVGTGTAMNNVDYADGGSFLTAVTATAKTFKAFTADGVTELATKDILLEDDQVYTLVLVQTAPGAPETSFLYFPDTVSAPASGKAKVRLVNTSPSQATLDIYVLAAGGDLAAATKRATLAYGASSDYYEVNAGNTRVVVTTTDTKTVLAEIATLPLVAGRASTVLTLDKAAGGTPITLTYWNDR
jgi:hypothetical protein